MTKVTKASILRTNGTVMTNITPDRFTGVNGQRGTKAQILGFAATKACIRGAIPDGGWLVLHFSDGSCVKGQWVKRGEKRHIIAN